MKNGDAGGREKPAGKSPEAEPAGRTLDEIVAVAREAQKLRKKFRIVSWILTAAIVVTFLVFGLLYYVLLKENFTEEKLLESLKENAELLRPALAKHTGELVADVGPVYSDLGRAKLQEVMPKWVKLGRKEIIRIGDSLGELAQEQLHDSLNAAVKKSGLEDELPELTDEQINRLQHRLELRVRSDLNDICEHMLDRTSGELIEISNTLDRFDLSGLPDDEDGLSRILTHDLLMLLDKQVMEPEEEDIMSKLVFHDLLDLVNEKVKEGN